MFEFWLCFVPLFTAMDGVSVLPLFIALTESVERPRIKKVIWQSLITATIVSIAFLFVGDMVLDLMGITISDFMIAGGILLFLIAIIQLIGEENNKPINNTESLGAVPIGVPLMVGPGVMTSSLLLSSQYGFILTIIALVVNILLVGLMFWFSGSIVRILGKAGTKAFSKISSLLLAAIAVMIIRKGIFLLLKTVK